MERPFPSAHLAKRPCEMPSRNTANSLSNDGSKRRPPPRPPLLSTPAGHVPFRLLSHASSVGSVIGKSGSIFGLFQQETGAKIRVEDCFADCEERVILIVGPQNPKKKLSVNSGTGAGENYAGGGEEVSPAQEALVRVFERVLDDDEGGKLKESVVNCRLLAPNGHVGVLMGKGGKTIERIRKKSGARLRVLPSEQLSVCAVPGDEVIQITGDLLAVKKALIAVSRCLQDSLPSDKMPAGVGKPDVFIPQGAFPDALGEYPLHQGSFLQPIRCGSVDYVNRNHPEPPPVEGSSTLDPRNMQQEIAFRLLCSNNTVGGVIGKGGAIVKALQNETGASIIVGGTVTGSDERVITISALGNMETRSSPVQDAVLRVFAKSIEVGVQKGLEQSLDKGGTVSCRLLIPSNQVGCLMGKGGIIISEMRRATGAGIQILRGDQVPKCASENEEVVQITGDLLAVKKAFIAVSRCLQDSPPSDKMPSVVSRSVGTIPREAFPDALGEHPLHQGSFLPPIRPGSVDYVNKSHPETPPGEGSSTLDPRNMQQEIAFRLLCSNNTVGGVIGKGGAIVKALQNGTGASIIVGGPVTGSDERVITISALENMETRSSPAQDAVLRVFARSIEVGVQKGLEQSLDKGGTVSCRLLISNQVGCLMGKGGIIISEMRRATGVGIQILGGDQVPKCASENEEVVQIKGDFLAVKKALIAVSHCLQDSPPSDKMPAVVSRPVGTIPQGTFPDALGEYPLHQGSFLPPIRCGSVDYVNRSHPETPPVEGSSTLDPRNMQQEIAFRLLCSNNTVGGVIGKGGAIVKALQNETGASIIVGGPVTGSDERVITISAVENTETRFSPAQDAVLHVFARSIEVGVQKGLELSFDKGGTVSCRLLIQSNQVGCLMHKGGIIISEMRKATGAGIWVLGGDQVPKCASENEEVVQLNGEFSKVQDALFQITSRLRENVMPTKILNGPAAGIYPMSTIPGTASYARVGEPTSPEMHPSLGHSHNLDHQTTLAHTMDHLGLSHNNDRPLSPGLWGSQTSGGNFRSITDTGRGLSSARGGMELGSGSISSVVTKTTMEIVVPENVLGSVYGENGSNLSRIKQISGAKVVVQDLQPGISEGMIIISGTPQQTQAAQSLLQAFILRGPSAADGQSQLL